MITFENELWHRAYSPVEATAARTFEIEYRRRGSRPRCRRPLRKQTDKTASEERTSILKSRNLWIEAESQIGAMCAPFWER